MCALSLKSPSAAMPGVETPALGLPYPSVETSVKPLNKTLLVYGGSSAVGSMTTQLATAAGIHVFSIVGAHNVELSKSCGATEIFDRNDPSVTNKVIDAVKSSGREFVGIFDAVSTPETYSHDHTILASLGGGHLACVHPPPSDTPANVKAGMIFAVNDVATPVWRDFVTPALQNGRLKCLPPPTVVGNGLESIQTALERMKAGVSASKLVVEL